MPGTKESKPAWALQIAAVRKRLGKSQTAFAEMLSTGQSNVANWESGKYRPSPPQLIALAQLIPGEMESLSFLELAGVPPGHFMGDTPKGTIPTVIAARQVREAEERNLASFAASGAITDLEGAVTRIPLLKDSAAAGTPRAVDEKQIAQLLPMPSSWLPRGAQLFALRVDGDSMEPILLNNHIVIVDVNRRDAKALINHMVVARGGDGITVKWLREDDGDYLLVPQHVSVRHPIKRLRKGGDWSIIGEVVKWIGEPPPPPKKR